jgi:bud site selection protein 31
MSSIRRNLGKDKPPDGWDLIEEVVEDFERQMKEAVAEDMEHKRKCESLWKIHKIHWTKNRFIFDLMFKRKVISNELFEWLVRKKVIDSLLIDKWLKPGYEILCSMIAIQKCAQNFGTSCHCRVPIRDRSRSMAITPNVKTGCISCCSGDGFHGGPLWWSAMNMNHTDSNSSDNFNQRITQK